ncbi:MAG: serine--tRNA ligase [Henriciella sp.]
MFDIKAIREAPDEFRQAWNRKKAGSGDVVDRIMALAETVRQATTRKQDAETVRNTNSKLIGKAKATGDEVEAQRLMQIVADAKALIEQSGTEELAAQGELDNLLSGLPNLPLPDVPAGESEDENVQQGEVWGQPREFSFPVQDHADFGSNLKDASGASLLDFEAATNMSGARFVAIRGQLARLERALGAFMLDFQTETNAYTEVSPPLLVRSQALYGTGQLPKFEEDLFKVGDQHYLIPTAEVPLTNMVAGQILSDEQLPLRMTAQTPCFRSEAGSAGRDTKGMIRLHQFNKVELVSIVRDQAEGLAELERMTRCAEAVLEALNLPYRRMLLCAGDMGAGARKTYDLEVWLPSQNTYREISSCSYCGDFQARRMNARWRPAVSEATPKPKPVYAHTLNGSGLAVGRTLVAIMENYQEADGSLTVPPVLRGYLGGLESIG